jgi:hypothetical protein
VAIGYVGEVAHHLDVLRVVQRVEGANLDREGGVGDVDDVQASAPSGHVGDVAHHLDVHRPAPRRARVEEADLHREGRIGDVDDAQPPRVKANRWSHGRRWRRSHEFSADHVGQATHHLDVFRGVRCCEGAELHG